MHQNCKGSNPNVNRIFTAYMRTAISKVTSPRVPWLGLIALQLSAFEGTVTRYLVDRYRSLCCISLAERED